MIPRRLFPVLIASSLLAFAVAPVCRAVGGPALAAEAEEVKPLKPGALAPTAMLAGMDGRDFDLAGAFAAKPTVLIFYRGGWCPFCNRHLAALADIEMELRALGCQIIAVTPEPAAKLARTAEANRLRYRLLSDSALRLTPAYGIAFRIPAETGRAYRENDIELTPVPDGHDYWLPVPSVFIVGRDGLIKFAYANPDPSVRIQNEELLAAVRAARL
jgi:peroxiredoxin